jgi:hypothetical protein
MGPIARHPRRHRPAWAMALNSAALCRAEGYYMPNEASNCSNSSTCSGVRSGALEK